VQASTKQNLKPTNAAGIDVPAMVLARADEVIQ
jgi:hypothetical protein